MDFLNPRINKEYNLKFLIFDKQMYRTRIFYSASQCAIQAVIKLIREMIKANYTDITPTDNITINHKNNSNLHYLEYRGSVL